MISVAVTLAVGVNTDGRREVLGMAIGASEAEPFWTEFLRDLVRRGLSGVKLVVSDAHEGIKAATARVLSTTWQRCRVHFQRNALAHAGKSSRRVVSAFIATAFAQPDHDAASAKWRRVADQMRPKLPKLATLMDGAEEDVLATITFPPPPRQAPFHEPDRASERRDQATHGRGRDLPERGRHPPPGRRDPDGADRGIGGSALTIHDAGNARPRQR
ncbi:transposase for insertion sequence element IS1081 [Stappia sp. 22II-S9-Z10]|nr:transposase for insertion sequence element IS1081 [Stappia sp. 22II-S9-Z10]